MIRLVPWSTHPELLAQNLYGTPHVETDQRRNLNFVRTGNPRARQWRQLYISGCEVLFAADINRGGFLYTSGHKVGQIA